MDSKNNLKNYATSIALFLGLTVLGFFIFRGLKTFSDKDRIVTVKGLAEMDMTATESAINISFNFSGDNLKEIVKKMLEEDITIFHLLLPS